MPPAPTPQPPAQPRLSPSAAAAPHERMHADLERKTADKVASIVLNKDLRDVRNINNWIQSLLRKEADLGEGHQPGDIEDLSRRVKDAVFREVEARRIRPEDLSERCIAVLNDLPVNAAVEVRRSTPSPLSLRKFPQHSRECTPTHRCALSQECRDGPHMSYTRRRLLPTC